MRRQRQRNQTVRFDQQFSGLGSKEDKNWKQTNKKNAPDDVQYSNEESADASAASKSPKLPKSIVSPRFRSAESLAELIITDSDSDEPAFEDQVSQNVQVKVENKNIDSEFQLVPVKSMEKFSTPLNPKKLNLDADYSLFSNVTDFASCVASPVKPAQPFFNLESKESILIPNPLHNTTLEIPSKIKIEQKDNISLETMNVPMPPKPPDGNSISKMIFFISEANEKICLSLITPKINDEFTVICTIGHTANSHLVEASHWFDHLKQKSQNGVFIKFASQFYEHEGYSEMVLKLWDGEPIRTACDMFKLRDGDLITDLVWETSPKSDDDWDNGICKSSTWKSIDPTKFNMKYKNDERCNLDNPDPLLSVFITHDFPFNRRARQDRSIETPRAKMSGPEFISYDDDYLLKYVKDKPMVWITIAEAARNPFFEDMFRGIGVANILEFKWLWDRNDSKRYSALKDQLCQVMNCEEFYFPQVFINGRWVGDIYNMQKIIADPHNVASFKEITGNIINQSDSSSDDQLDSLNSQSRPDVNIAEIFPSEDDLSSPVKDLNPHVKKSKIKQEEPSIKKEPTLPGPNVDERPRASVPASQPHTNSGTHPTAPVGEVYLIVYFTACASMCIPCNSLN